MKAFTLIEIVIVMVIIGIITWMVMLLSGAQLQKLQYETLKQHILSEYQSRYSKNLTSSFHTNQRYDTMQMVLKAGESWIRFEYFTGEQTPYWTERIQGDFVIEHIFTDPDNYAAPSPVTQLTWIFKPYEIACALKSVDNGNDIHKIILLTRLKEKKYYCFSIHANMCRMTVLSDEVCKQYEILATW